MKEITNFIGMNRVLKYLVFTLAIFLAFADNASAQWTRPNTAYGNRQYRIAIDSTFFFPTGCGTPNGVSGLRLLPSSSGNLKQSAIYFDSCGGQFWVFNPKSSAWIESLNNGGDTSIFNTVIDSTGQPFQSVLVAGPDNNIRGYAYFLYDSANGKVWIKTPPTYIGGPILQVDGPTWLNGAEVSNSLVAYGEFVMPNEPLTPGKTDTVNYKPVVMHTDGTIERAAHWYGSGGAAGVTSVGISSTDLSVTGSPVTGAGTITLDLLANAVTDAKLRQSAGNSVIGRANNTAGNPTDIIASTPNTFLGYNGATVGFAKVPIAGIDATGTPSSTTSLRGDGTWGAAGTALSGTGYVKMSGTTPSYNAQIPVADGGTNISSYTTGDILYASASGVLSKLPIGTSAQTLHVVSGLPAWRDTAVAGGGGGTPAGSNTQIQYNNSGAFGANSNFVWDITNARLGIGTPAPKNLMNIWSDGDSATLRISSGPDNKRQQIFFFEQETANPGQHGYLLEYDGLTNQFNFANISNANRTNIINTTSSAISLNKNTSVTGTVSSTGAASFGGNTSVTGTLTTSNTIALTNAIGLHPIAGTQSVISSWWGLQLSGMITSNPALYSPSAVGTNSVAHVIIKMNNTSAHGLYVKGIASQTGNYLTTESSSGTADIFNIKSNGAVGIGTNTVNSNSLLDFGGTNKYTRPFPLMTTTQRNAISVTSADEGGGIYNTTTHTFDVHDGTGWRMQPNGLSGSATLDFGSTSAQTSADLTIAVTGAADGDAVYVGVPNASVNANSSYTAWVSAANTVTVRFNNYSSGSIDPASGSFKVFVKKN